MTKAADKIIVALDVATKEKALELVEQLRGEISFFKIGLQLYTAVGPEIVRAVLATGAKVGANHFAAAAQMNSEHLHPESARGPNRSRDGVGDIVELQIEPDLCAGGQNGAHNFGAFGRVKLEPDFEERYLASELLNELECLLLCGDIKRHDDFVSGCCHGRRSR